ncbi:integrase core domain-containing protein [Paenibacillus sambharensis]|uniref:integrase core domain-containing protein n=1 Tax=Paenibacillus sambharensis TaxID=1803190 RepID=UPI0026BCC8D6
MVERENAAITIKRQATLLSVNRTCIYRPSQEKRESEENVQIMHRIDEITVKHPYFGYRRMTRFHFRSLKYECIFLNEFEDPRALRKGIARYVQFYNQECPHQSLNEAKPDEFSRTLSKNSYPKILSSREGGYNFSLRKPCLVNGEHYTGPWC